MKKYLILAFLFFITPVLADPNTASPVTTIPFGLNNVDNESNQILSTNTFQQVFDVSPGRSSCTIQNNASTRTMFIFYGASTPTTATSFQLAAGLSTSCENVGGSVIKAKVQITGTTSDTYYAVQW